MEEEVFQIQKSIPGLSDLLAIKSGGEQFDSLSKLLNPTVEIGELLFPIESVTPPAIQLTQATTNASLANLFQHGRSGIYRVRGTATMAGTNGVNAGHFKVYIGGTSLRIPIMDVVAAASAIFNSPPVVLDTLIDLRAMPPGASINVFLDITAAATEVQADLNLTAVRVR